MEGEDDLGREPGGSRREARRNGGQRVRGQGKRRKGSRREPSVPEPTISRRPRVWSKRHLITFSLECLQVDIIVPILRTRQETLWGLQSALEGPGVQPAWSRGGGPGVCGPGGVRGVRGVADAAGSK